MRAGGTIELGLCLFSPFDRPEHGTRADGTNSFRRLEHPFVVALRRLIAMKDQLQVPIQWIHIGITQFVRYRQ
ncbi:hypothetical protein RB4005 [Rhodopirellula baltica SH 1]|uniref:Uncharacterized protein n=1 Tax=Rhodopirellula baltica (strain DSM 10527 / NCIMB 13988 / SH1) TaxID=243090 RepID=Q7UT98_RHOBA|nr:hypothetical protein RB4005 [Rhodopirellula baltica SH 1]